MLRIILSLCCYLQEVFPSIRFFVFSDVVSLYLGSHCPNRSVKKSCSYSSPLLCFLSGGQEVARCCFDLQCNDRIQSRQCRTREVEGVLTCGASGPAKLSAWQESN
jgi:hypothetical protein